MADPKRQPARPAGATLGGAAFCAARRAARQQDTVQVDLIAASFDSLRSDLPARPVSEHRVHVITVRRVTDPPIGGLCNFPMWV